jgi:ABC-type multidrug transport system permease subunit
MGSIFFQISNTQKGIQSRIGVLFFLCVNQTFGNTMPILAVFPEQRQINKRERASGSYRASSAYIAKTLSCFPLSILGCLLLIIPLYWIVGLQADAGKFVTYLIVLLIHSLSSTALGLAIGSAVPTVRVGQIVGPLIITVFLLFGGQVVNLDEIPMLLSWIQYFSLVTFSNKALAQNEFQGMTFECPTPGQCYQTGEQVLDNFSFQSPDIWLCELITSALGMGLLVLGYILFRHTSAPQIRLDFIRKPHSSA